MLEHKHMFHLPKTLNADPKAVSHEPPRGAALQSEPQAHSGWAGKSQRKHTNDLSLTPTWTKRNKDWPCNHTWIKDVLYVSTSSHRPGGQPQHPASPGVFHSPAGQHHCLPSTQAASGPRLLLDPSLATIKKLISINPQHIFSLLIWLLLWRLPKSHTPQHPFYHMGWRRQFLRKSDNNTTPAESTWNCSDASLNYSPCGLCTQGLVFSRRPDLLWGFFNFFSL